MTGNHLPPDRMMRNTNLSSLGVVLTVCLLGASPANAQQNSDGSLYSRFGIGELYQYQSSQIQAMGGGGTALTSVNYLNLANPATWSDQVFTRVGASVQFQGLQITNADGNESRLNSSVLQAFQFSFPLRQGKLGFGLTYTPISRVAHKVRQSQTNVPDPTIDVPAAYNISFEGQGGLQKASLGIGYRPVRNASFGASLDFVFGILRETRKTEFNTVDFSGTDFKNSTRLKGVSGSLGGHFTKSNLLRQNDALSLGLNVSLPTILDGTQVRTIGQSLDQDTLGTAVKGNLELPIRSNFGLAYYIGSRWVFVADMSYEPWSNFDGELGLPGFVPGISSSFMDRTRISGGIGFQPSVNTLDSYFKRVSYRIGIYVDNGYLSISDNVDLTTLALTGGLSLPTLFPGTHLDLNFELGRRGSADFNFVKESFFKIHINVNIGERWFERRKLG
jgi:hypothetical protein